MTKGKIHNKRTERKEEARRMKNITRRGRKQNSKKQQGEDRNEREGRQEKQE